MKAEKTGLSMEQTKQNRRHAWLMDEKAPKVFFVMGTQPRETMLLAKLTD